MAARKNVHPIRFNDTEYNWLKKKADEKGVSIGEFIRDWVKKQVEMEETRSA